MGPVNLQMVLVKLLNIYGTTEADVKGTLACTRDLHRAAMHQT